MKQSTFSAVMANSIKNLLQGYTKGIRFVAVLMVLLTMGIGQAWGAEETITLSDFGWGDATVQSSITATSATISLAKNSAGTAPTYYTNGGLRIYGVKKATTGGTISFTPKTGITISKIVFTHTSENSGVLAIKTGTGSYSSKTWSGTLMEGSTVSLVSTNNSDKNPQVRITQIVITYTKAAAQTYNVILSRNGVTETINDVEEGTALDVIDGTGDQGGCSPEWVFEGWSKTQRPAQNNTAVMDLVTTVDGAGPYYAVYSHTAEGGGGSTTVEMSSFSAVSGNVNKDANVSYEAAQGTAGTPPAVNDSEIRIYQNGGTLTITGNNGKKLTSITIGSSMATSVSYKVDGGTESSNQSIAANGKFTLSEIEASSVLFTCKGTDKNSRLYLNYLSVTYSGGNTVYYTTSPSCATQTAVTLAPQGGTGGTTSVTATYGQPMPTITPPTLAGYDFQGYYTANLGSGTKYYNADGTSAKNWEEEDPTFTLIAYWVPQTYTVTLNNQGATTAGATSVTATYNAAMPSIASNLPKKTGYTFGGYFTGQNGTGTKYYNANGSSAKKWDKTANDTLYAQWTCETPEFDIKIKNDNPVVFSGESIELTVDGSNIAADATYQWYKYNGTTYDELTGQTANKLTIAEATANDAGNYKCVVTNGTCSGENNYTVKMYHIKGLTDAAWEESFEFEKSGDKEGSFTIELAATTTYYFKLNDGSVWYWNEGTMTHNNCTDWVIEQEGADTQGKANTGITTTASGTYTFTLNYADPAKPELSVTYPQKKMVYLNPGNWNCPKYAVYSWDGDGNSTVLMTKIDDCADRNIYQAEIDASHSNVIFIGGTASYNVANTWANVSYQTIDLTYPSDDKVLYEINTTHLFLVPNSNWKESNARFAAYFYGNGETWVSMTKVTADLYKVAIPTTKTYPSVIFCRMNPSAAANNWNNKWNQSADLTITKGKNHYTIEDGAWDKGGGTWKTAGDWTAFTPNYTVTFDANGHGSAPADQCITDGGKATQPTPAPTATGYTFGGWYKDADCTNAWDFANDVVTSDITLYAKWTINTHTVTWNPAGGNQDGNASNIVQTYEYDELIKAPEKPVRTGYEFVEWTPAYASDMTMPDEDMEFTAQWQINQYTVTLNPNYPAGKTGTFTYEEGELVDGNLVFTYDYNTTSKTIEDLYTSLTLDGYEFGGWYNAKGSNPGEVSGSKCTTTGDITGNKTYYAKWTKVYSVILSENGTTKELTPQTSTSYTLPTELSVGTCENDEKELVGWSTVAIPTPGDKPTTNFYELGETVTLTADQTTFYAVFATGTTTDESITTNGQATLSFENVAQRTHFSETQQVWEQNGIIFTNNKANSSTDIGNYANPVRCYKNSEIIIDCNALGNIAKVQFKCSSSAYASDLASSIGTEAIPSETWATLTPTSETKTYTITLSAGQTRISSLTVTYKAISDNVSTTYTDYTTACAAIPDPVWGGAEIDQTTIHVDCGSMTKLNAATSNGPATISFPTATNHTLTYGITVTASEGFLVSTNKTDATKYGESVTVTPNKTGENAGKITQNVYVVAVAPAMSDEDFTGTITLSGKQLAENQVIDVTADVTCTTYTLTLDDRGTKTTAEYYAGASVPKPADPEGVCTDPINYVFDGWSLDPVTDENTTSYEKVTFPFDMPAEKKTLYAVYRYLEGGGNGDYNLVTSALDDWSGDYLIAYSDKIFANGTIGGESGIGAKNNKVDLSSNISNNTIPATVGDQYNVTLEAVTGGYVLKTQDGKYNYHTNNTGNGISASTIGYADDYPISVDFVSQEEINLCLGGNAIGSKFRYNTDGYFRFYKNGGQQPIYLYKKADGTTYYTTSPVCGPHLVITEGKEIYVTGGNAGGTRDLVIAQQKVSYKATRLNVGPTSQVPDVKVATNGITVGGVVTSDVKVTIDQTKEQQTDGTYTITGTITIQYQPSANNKQEDIQVQLAVDYNAEARDNFTVHARSLPAEFVIVAKSGDKWYALNGDMNNGSSANPANGQVTLDDDANPTKATYAPCNTIYTFDGLPNTGDRTRVRFQGTDGAWLWAASGTNVGIQNKSLKDTPEGDNKAYNWKLETEDNITYKFHNDNSSRLLGLSGEKFGMYASAVQELRILPYVEKCLYNYAPSNLIVKELKGSYVVLTWDAVVGATKYQYRTNATTWTDAGTEPTVTINGLTGDTEYTYYVRAYHEDAGVSQECIDYAEITFTTADCDDVPTNITYTADLNSITVSWTAAAPTATIKLFMNEDGTGGGGTYPGATSPYTISGGLDKNTTYYIQILSDGTCASPIIPVKTEDVELDIVEWKTDGIVVDINTNETVGVTLENEVSYGTGLGTEATELFFSKYYEATGNVKLVAVYNGTKNIIDLTNYTIQYGKTSWESNYITLKDFGTIKGQIQPGEEIILYSMQEKNAEDDKEIMDCVHEQYPDGAWVKVTASNNEGGGNLQFGGDKTIILCETRYDETDGEYYDYILDVIGALTDDFLPDPSATEKPSWGDKEGWVCQTGLSIADDSQIGISTNRCLLIRNNTVTSGENAVASNINDFVTLCTEWKGAQVPDNDIDNGVAASCENFAYVGTFDYSDYYTKYVPMDGGTSTFDENDRNPDGTVTISILDLYKRACSNIRVKLTNSNGDVLTDREYKVPIMITSTQGTNGQTFLDLQQNLATKEVDAEGNVIRTYPLTLDEVREICKTCDVVIRDNATLTKVTDGTENDHPQVNNVMIYEGASLEIPSGADYNYTINSLSLRRKGDIVASAKVEEGGKLHLPASATAPIYLDMRVDANNWHWFTLPYNCNIADVTWVDGTPAQYNKDWFIMFYDGNSRANEQSIYENHWKVYNGTTIEAGKGYIVGIQGDITHPDYTFELRFPMTTDVLTNEHIDKTVAVNAWGVDMDITPNKKGWNLVGNPYLDYYKTSENISFKGLSLIKYGSIDSVTGDRLYDDSGNIPFLVSPVDGGWYEYKQELASEVEMNPFTAYFVQVGDPANENHTDGMELHAEFVSDNRGRMSLIRRAPQEVDGEQDPVIVRVEVANAKGESDKTTLIIDDRFTNEYEMNADFFKWFGDYYRRYTKPVLYSMGADQGKRAFNALSEQLAAQPVALGMFAAQAGDYTFSLTRKRCDLSSVEEVWLYDATTATYTNLMQQDYTFTTAKTEGEGRFYLSVKMKQKTPTAVENVNGNLSLVAHQQTLVLSGLPAEAQVWVYDATGKLLHSEHTTAYQRIYPVQQAGVYFVSVKGQGDAQTLSTIVK